MEKFENINKEDFNAVVDCCRAYLFFNKDRLFFNKNRQNIESLKKEFLFIHSGIDIDEEFYAEYIDCEDSDLSEQHNKLDSVREQYFKALLFSLVMITDDIEQLIKELVSIQERIEKIEE